MTVCRVCHSLDKPRRDLEVKKYFGRASFILGTCFLAAGEVPPCSLAGVVLFSPLSFFFTSNFPGTGFYPPPSWHGKVVALSPNNILFVRWTIKSELRARCHVDSRDRQPIFRVENNLRWDLLPLDYLTAIVKRVLVNFHHITRIENPIKQLPLCPIRRDTKLLCNFS